MKEDWIRFLFSTLLLVRSLSTPSPPVSISSSSELKILIFVVAWTKSRPSRKLSVLLSTSTSASIKVLVFSLSSLRCLVILVLSSTPFYPIHRLLHPSELYISLYVLRNDFYYLKSTPTHLLFSHQFFVLLVFYIHQRHLLPSFLFAFRACLEEWFPLITASSKTDTLSSSSTRCFTRQISTQISRKGSTTPNT